MRDEILSYYERELTYLRQIGGEFAQQYPKVAARLQLDANRCEDPHVERLIESFAFLASRVHKKLDDEFPEITQALLNIVYPQYVRPVPSMSVVQFSADPVHTRLTTNLRLERGTLLYSKQVGGIPCKFRTCYDADVWPLNVVEARWCTPDRLDPPVKGAELRAALRVEFECWPDVHLEKLDMPALRLYLDGEPNIVHPLYELLANNCTQILLRDPRPKFRQRAIPLPPDALRPVGFADNEEVLPFPRRAFQGYRLLQEYFCFPEKYFFFDLTKLEPLRWSGFKERFEVIFLISEFEKADRHELLEAGVGSRTVRLGCTPVINCFDHLAEPIQLDQTRFEYPVTPDAWRAHAIEVFQIDEVRCTNHKTQEVTDFDPLFSFRHSSHGQKQPTFWHATRRIAEGRADGQTEMVLALVDLSGRPVYMNLDTLTVRCTCTNGDLPARLPWGEEAGDFEIEGSSAISRAVALRKPTPTYRPAVSRDMLWRLISHLSLNYLSLVEEGREALQEILRLYAPSGQPFMDQQIDGVAGLRSERRFARVVSEHGITYVRGVYVEMELDEDRFVGGGVYLFSAVLEQFFAQYVSLNSFSQLAIKTRQRKEVMREWLPRAGNRILL